ncbi:MAG: hypothetical protein JW791_03430 [Nanoarchaeota archaeon]|nr:hypothetical protein [Nanoarchaeota archaeon]
MIEIREDLISKRKVIINETRSLRPHNIQEPDSKKRDRVCVFCPGNEQKTPPELSRTGTEKKWTIRVFPNKYPILTLQRYKQLKNNSFKSWKGHGNNEVIVLTPDNEENPFNFSLSKWFEIIKMYQERISHNFMPQEIKYVLLFHNQGPKSGASISHAHSQLASFPFIPDVIRKEAGSCSKKLCCEMISYELKQNRLVFKNKDFIVFCNYASRFPFETHIYPVKHVKSITLLSDELVHSLSEVLLRLMKVFKKVFGGLDYNFVIHDAPKNKDYHFHIEFYPQILKFAGVEYGADVNVNNISPETAAKILRGVLD